MSSDPLTYASLIDTQDANYNPNSSEGIYIFNPSDILSSGEPLTYATLTSSTNEVSTASANLYIKKAGDVIPGTIEFQNGLIINHGIQIRAYSEDDFNNVDSSRIKTLGMTTTGEETGQYVTTFTGDVVIPGLVLQNDQLTTNKIYGLQPSLDNLQNDIYTLQNEKTALQNKDSEFQTTINDISASVIDNRADIDILIGASSSMNSTISTIQSNITDMSGSIVTINTKINDISGSIFPAIDALNSQASTVANSIATINTKNNRQDTSLNTIFSTVADNTTDITALNGTVSGHTSSLSSLNTTVSQHTTQINGGASSIALMQNDITTLNGAVSSLNSLTASHTSSLSTQSAKLTQHDTSLNDHQTLLNSHTSSIASHASSLSSLSTSNITLSNTIATKQDIINGMSKLDTAYIGNGDVTNNELSTLADIDTTQTIQHQIDGIKSTVSTLTGLENIDISNILILQSSVTSLTAYVNSLQNTDNSQNIINTNVNNQLSGLVTDLSGLTLRVGTCESSISTIQSMISSIQTNISTIQSNISDTTDAINQIGIDISNIVDDVGGLTTDLSGITTRMSTAESGITALNSSYIDISDVATNANNLAQTVANDIETLGDMIATKQNIINSSHKLAYTNVDFTGSTLGYLDISGSLNTKLTNIINDISGANTEIQALETAISNLQSADVIHEGLISSHDSAITSLQSTKQDVITSLPASKIDVSGTDLSTKIHDMLIDISGKQNIIDSSHKLGVSNIDLSGSALAYVDISSSLQSQLTSMTGAISTLQSLQNGDIIAFQDIDDNFTTLFNTKQNNIDSSNRLDASLLATGEVTNTKLNYLKNVTSDIQNQIDGLVVGGGGGGIASIDYDISNTLTTISGTTELTTLKFADNSIQNTAFTSAKNTLLSTVSDLSGFVGSLYSKVEDVSGDLVTLSGVVSGKQDIIDSSHKLGISNIDLSGSSLSYVDVTQSLNTSLSAINSAISALQTSDLAQTNNITTMSGTISTLQTAKQDLIDSGNKLSSLYVGYGASSNVSDEIDSLKSGKISASGAVFTGSVDLSNNTISNATSINSSASQPLILNGGNTVCSIRTSNTDRIYQIGANTIFASSGATLTSAWSSGTRSKFMTSTANGDTNLLCTANGTGTKSSFQFANSSSQVNNAVLDVGCSSATETYIKSGINGTGNLLPLNIYSNATKSLTVETDGTLTVPVVSNHSANINLTGTAKLKYPSGSSGQVLTSDATGLLSLTTPSAPSASLTSYIGTFTSDGSVFAMTNASWVAFSSIQVPAGTYIFFGKIGVTANSSINMVYEEIGISTVSTNTYPNIYAQRGLMTTSSGSATPISTTPFTQLYTCASTTTVYLMGSLQYGNTSTFSHWNSAGRYFHAVKIA